MIDPLTLIEYAGPDADPDGPPGEGPVLVHAFDGFVDAGSAARLAVAQLLDTLPHRPLVRFDVDQLHDYRARRPPMTFVEDRWTGYQAPELVMHRVDDAAGTPFLLLAGPEPDVAWERFVAAVTRLVDRYRVRLTIGLAAIPMAVPHTRPPALTAHGRPRELVADHTPWIGRVQVPGHVAGLLELRLTEAGRPAVGFAAHVPHYLAQAEYPDAAVVLLDAVSRVSGLSLPTGPLREAGERVRRLIAEQVGEQPDVAEVVGSLERQYDDLIARRGRAAAGAVDDGAPLGDDVMGAEELGAELERFLADEDERRRRGHDG